MVRVHLWGLDFLGRGLFPFPGFLYLYSSGRVPSGGTSCCAGSSFTPEEFWLFSGPLVAATVVLAFAELLSLAFLPLVAATVELWLIAFSSLVAATVELLLVAFLFPPEVLVACLDTTV